MVPTTRFGKNLFFFVRGNMTDRQAPEAVVMLHNWATRRKRWFRKIFFPTHFLSPELFEVYAGLNL